MHLEAWLRYQGFAPFIEVGNPTRRYEDRSAAYGGIRVEICDYVASVWCPYLKENHPAIPTSEVRPIVARLLERLERLRLIKE